MQHAAQDRLRLGWFIFEVAPTLVIHEKPGAIGKSLQRASPKISSRRSGECLDFEIRKAVLRRLGLQKACRDPYGDQASGLLLQMLPDSESSEEFDKVCALAAQADHAELATLEGMTLLKRLFPEFNLRVFRAREVAHDCRCTPDHLAGITRMLGEDELESILTERGSVELTCEFCNRAFQYSREQIGEILRGETPQATLH